MHHFDFGLFEINQQIQNQDVSETQTAECRSSKPDVAGSIPVAHFISCSLLKEFSQLTTNNQPQIKRRRVVSTGKISVSKTKVLSSNLSAPVNFSPPKAAKKDVISSPLTSLFLTRKASQIGMAAVLKTAALRAYRGSSPLLSVNFYGFVAQRIRAQDYES